MPPRKIRETPEARALRAITRMSAGTIAGRVESASPARRLPDARITQGRGAGCPCPVNVRHCTGGGGGASFSEGDFQARYDFADFDDYDAWVLANSPIAYYRMDEASGTVLADASGNGHDLNTFGGPTLNQTGPLSGMKAVAFDGVDDYARDLSSSTLGSVSNLMVMGWFKTSSVGGSDAAPTALVSTRDTSLGGGISVGYGAGWGAFGGGVSGAGALTFADDGHNSLGGRFTQEDYSDDAWHLFHAIWTGAPAGHFCGNPPDPECFDTWSVYADGDVGTMTDINEGVNTNFHNPPLSGENLNIAKYVSWYWAGLLAGLAFFTGETVVGEPCELLKTDDVLIIDGGGTVTLPPAASAARHIYYIKSDAGTVTLDPDGSETIDNAATLSFGPLESAAIISDGTEWWVL